MAQRVIVCYLQQLPGCGAPEIPHLYAGREPCHVAGSGNCAYNGVISKGRERAKSQNTIERAIPGVRPAGVIVLIKV